MKCPNCRTEMRSKMESYIYDESGIPVILAGVKVSTCPACREHCVAIPHMEGLHKLIAETLIRKPGRLHGAEIRFLRTYVGWSGRDFAAKLQVSAETVSRWERGKQPIGAHADALVRLAVALGARIQDYSVEDALSLESAPPVGKKLRFRLSEDGDWTPPALAC